MILCVLEHWTLQTFRFRLKLCLLIYIYIIHWMKKCIHLFDDISSTKVPLVQNVSHLPLDYRKQSYKKYDLYINLNNLILVITIII